MRRLIGLALLATLASLPAQAKWTEVSSRHFVLLSEDAPEQLRQLAEHLERFDQAVRYVTQLPDAAVGRERRVTIYVVERSVVEELAGVGSAGIYLGRASGSIVLAVRSGNDATQTLFHEYVHHLQRSSRPMSWSFWYAEGAAEFFATAVMRPDGNVDIGLPLPGRALELGQLQYRSLPPLLEMSDAGLRVQGSLSYARSWLLVHYLMFEPTRQGQLQRYVRSLERGIDSGAAGSAVFGDAAALDRSLKSYAKGPFQHLTVSRDVLQAGTVVLRELSAGEQVVMPYHLRFSVGVDDERAHQLLSLLKAAAAPFSTDVKVQVALAEAEFSAGNYAAAEIATDRAIAHDAKRAAAHLYKARARMAAALRAGVDDPQQWAQVRQWFSKAHELEPDDPQPLILLYLSFAVRGQRPTPESVAGLYQACELAPQDYNLWVLAAYQYLFDGDAEQAGRLLALAASDPHTGEMAARTAAVLAMLERRGTAAALAAFSADDVAEVRARLWDR